MPVMRRRRLLPPLLSMVTALAVTAGPAAAAPGATVRLPVVPARLTAGAACTGASGERATAVPWEQQSLQLARTWQFAGGAGVTVGVVDTGVSKKAATLSRRVTALGGAGEDCVGHGTFVAGLIAAAPASGVQFAGVAQQARILAVRGTDARGAATATTVADGIRAAVDGGAKVIDVSLALSQGSVRLTSAVTYAAQHDALVVAAAVPDAPSTSTASTASPAPQSYWPAAQDGVLSVVDIDVNGARPTGAFTPSRADLAAPGDGVISIGPTGAGHYIGSGASLAAAYVAGAAALVRSTHPGLTATETARRLTSAAYPADTPRLDPYAAVTSVQDPAASQQAAATPAAPVRLPSDPAGARATHRALVLAGAGGALVLLVAWAAVIAPRGRARGWRPAKH
jgi:hypothetical protein